MFPMGYDYDGCYCIDSPDDDAGLGDPEEAGNEEGPEYWCESAGGTWDGEDCIY